MQLQKLVNMFGGDLSRRYGQKVHKLTLHGGFSCPNRDGTIGRGGCTFCNVASFADEAQQYRSIAEQLAHQAHLVNRAKRYLAYFQAYTSTFAEVQVLRSMYQQAVSQASIVGLCVGTRPDCVPDAVLDLLCEYKDQGYEVWLELGLQTAHDKTLRRINRGHDFACYQRTTQLARERGLKVCSHLIVGLPGEGQTECLQTLERVVETGVDGIKLHPLHIAIRRRRLFIIAFPPAPVVRRCSPRCGVRIAGRAWWSWTAILTNMARKAPRLALRGFSRGANHP